MDDSGRNQEYDHYYASYKEPLERYACSILREKFRGWEDAAGDCAQDALLKLARALAEGLKPFATDERDPVYVNNWLYDVTEKRAFEVLRKIKRHPQTGLDDFQGHDEGVEDRLLNNILRKELLVRLSDREQTILRLDSEGYSNEEIAAHLGMSIGYVKQLKSKAIRQLREWWRNCDN